YVSQKQLSSYVNTHRVAPCPLGFVGTQKYSHVKGYAHGGGSTRYPNMSYHGGVIMTTSTTKSIFWGPQWGNSAFVSDKITGLASFYTEYSNSNYAKTSDEYTGSNGTVGPTTTHQGYVIDTSPASGGDDTAAILAEVCKVINPDPSGNGYYPVYVD